MSRFHDRAGLKGPRWERLRRVVLVRDSWTCQTCGKSAGRFEVDHIVPLHLDPSKAWDRANLQTLCGGPGGCHAAKTAGENQTIDRRPQDRAAWARLIYKVM